QHIDGARVRKFVYFTYIVVTKTELRSELTNVGLFSSKKCPFHILSFAERLEIGLAFGCSEIGAFARIDADGDDAEMVARCPLQLSQAIDEAVELHGAEHGAVVIVQGKGDGM